MQTSTLAIILAAVVAVLVVMVALLLWHSYRQERDMKLKDDSIVREVRRNQRLVDYGVSQGLSRSAMLNVLKKQ
jgi:sensor domain CHASE-containing protein